MTLGKSAECLNVDEAEEIWEKTPKEYTYTRKGKEGFTSIFLNQLTVMIMHPETNLISL